MSTYRRLSFIPTTFFYQFFSYPALHQVSSVDHAVLPHNTTDPRRAHGSDLHHLMRSRASPLICLLSSVWLCGATSLAGPSRTVIRNVVDPLWENDLVVPDGKLFAGGVDGKRELKEPHRAGDYDAGVLERVDVGSSSAAAAASSASSVSSTSLPSPSSASNASSSFEWPQPFE